MCATPGTADSLTELILSARAGSEQAKADLYAALYGDLKRLAAHHMRGERANHTLQPTALVNEAFVRYFHDAGAGFHNRSHFLAVASQVMRRILVDHARSRRAVKRGGAAKQVELSGIEMSPRDNDQLLVLDEALTRLSQMDPRVAQVVEMRFFGGLTEDEIAAAMGVSSRTVKRDWKFAQAWFFEQPGLR